MNNYSNTSIRKDVVVGSRRFSNYLWGCMTLVGGISFVIAGLSSYLKIELLPFTTTTNLAFIPQGITMIFYGTTAIVLSIFIWITIIFDVGGGYNKFDKLAGIITIFRFGFPGRNRQIVLTYNVQSVMAIQIKVQNGLNPKREVYLKTKNQTKIPLTRIGQPLYLFEIEQQAADLARFLNVMLEKI